MSAAQTTKVPDHIWVVAVEEADDRAFWDRRKVDREKLELGVFQTKMAEFVASMQAVIARVEEEAGRWRLDEVQVAVEIGSKGSVNLLGTGAEISSTGGLSLTFRREQ